MEQWKLALVVGAVALGGVALGGVLFSSEPASAQTAPYTQCIIARQESIDTNESGRIAERPSPARLIEIPPGWEPVGGGGLNGNWVSSVVLCRR